MNIDYKFDCQMVELLDLFTVKQLEAIVSAWNDVRLWDCELFDENDNNTELPELQIGSLPFANADDVYATVGISVDYLVDDEEDDFARKYEANFRRLTRVYDLFAKALRKRQVEKGEIRKRINHYNHRDLIVCIPRRRVRL